VAEKIIFKNSFLIDGRGGAPLSDATLVVSGSRIEAVLHEGSGRFGPTGKVIDLEGKTLMPGLIDAHVHPGNVAYYLHQTAALEPAVYVHRVTRTLETDLNLGFTTLRDAAGLDQGFRVAIEEGLIRGPRLFLSVTPLTRPDNGEAPNPRNSLGIRPETCRGAEGVRQAVRRTLDRGADQIKVFADGEVVSQSKTDKGKPGQPRFSVEELRAAVKAAEAAGSYVMAHAYSPRAIQNCLKAGVRSIEHGNLLDLETAEMMVKKGAFFVPTLTIYDIMTREGPKELDAYTIEKLGVVGQKGIAALELAYRAGVRIGSGSDIIGPLQHLKGRELAIKGEVMSPMEAIVSATRSNAELLGIADRLGTLEPGKTADLIVLDKNPLEDLTIFESGLERVALVMKDGKIMKNLI
jgi:imidazolonepropionase-like amidohydrolase